MLLVDSVIPKPDFRFKALGSVDLMSYKMVFHTIFTFSTFYFSAPSPFALYLVFTVTFDFPLLSFLSFLCPSIPLSYQSTLGWVSSSEKVTTPLWSSQI